MTLAFRRATMADVGALHALIESAYRGETARSGWTHEADLLDGQRTDVETLTRELRDTKRFMLIGEVDGALAACAALTDKGAGLAQVGLVTVNPMRQGDGLGRALLIEAERVGATMLGAKILEMTVIGRRTELIDWYWRRGYVATGEVRPFPYGDTRFGIPTTSDLEFVVLTKQLGNTRCRTKSKTKFPACRRSPSRRARRQAHF